jgi:hypothetical protein
MLAAGLLAASCSTTPGPAETPRTGAEGPPGRVAAFDGVGAVAPNGIGPVYAFVTDATGNLWANWWDGFKWSWSNYGRPPGTVHRLYPVGATTRGGRAYVFVIGDVDGWSNLWLGVVDGANRLEWQNRGTLPTGLLAKDRGAAISQNDDSPCALVLSTGRDIWAHCLTGSSWSWLNLGQPAKFSLDFKAAAAPRAEPMRVAYVAARDQDGDIWFKWFFPGGKQVSWQRLGRPDSGPTELKGLATLGDLSCPRVDVYATSSKGLWVCPFQGDQQCTWQLVDEGYGGVCAATLIRYDPGTQCGTTSFRQFGGVYTFDGRSVTVESMRFPAALVCGRAVGAMTVEDRPYFWLLDEEGALWALWKDSGSIWHWAKQGWPSAMPVGESR